MTILQHLALSFLLAQFVVQPDYGLPGTLLVLAAGAFVAGMALHSWFIGEAQSEFWNGAIFNGSGNKIVEQLETVPAGVEYAPQPTSACG